MANIPCAKRVLCAPGFGQTPGDLEFDSPLANFSSEAPDQELFIGFNFGWDLNLPNLGWFWNDPSWPGFCDSPISQAAADLCAGNQQLQNTYQGGYIPINPWRNQNGTPVPLVGNDQQQCSYTCPDGLLFVWTVAPNQVLQPSLARANQIANSIACQLAIQNHLCLGSLSPACLNTPYLGTINVTGGASVKPPFTFTIVDGALPPGLILSPSATSCSVTGSPDTAGQYSFTVRATDSNGNFMQKQYLLQVVGITNIASLPNPRIGSAYSENLLATGGTAPYVFRTGNGALPAGLSLSATGVISGTPTGSAGAFIVQFIVTDAAGVTCAVDWNGTVDTNACTFFNSLIWNNPPDLLIDPFGAFSEQYPQPNQVLVHLQYNGGGLQVSDADNSNSNTPIAVDAAPVTCTVRVAATVFGSCFCRVVVVDGNNPAVTFLDTGGGGLVPIGTGSTDYTFTKPNGVTSIMVGYFLEAGLSGGAFAAINLTVTFGV